MTFNTWSPACWQSIQRTVQILTGIKPSCEAIEAFIDEQNLWKEDCETISSRIVADIQRELSLL